MVRKDVVLIYLTIMTPDAIGYDGAWEHQVIAQEYARNGRIVALPADYVKNHPQLAPVVYASTGAPCLPAKDQA